jgi:hypothetical protein
MKTGLPHHRGAAAKTARPAPCKVASPEDERMRHGATQLWLLEYFEQGMSGKPDDDVEALFDFSAN